MGELLVSGRVPALFLALAAGLFQILDSRPAACSVEPLMAS